MCLEMWGGRFLIEFPQENRPTFLGTFLSTFLGTGSRHISGHRFRHISGHRSRHISGHASEAHFRGTFQIPLFAFGLQGSRPNKKAKIKTNKTRKRRGCASTKKTKMGSFLGVRGILCDGSPNGSYQFPQGAYRIRSDPPMGPVTFRMEPTGSIRMPQRILSISYWIRPDPPMDPITSGRVPLAYLQDPITLDLMCSDPPADPMAPVMWKQDPIRK